MLARFLRPAEIEVEEAVAYFDQQREGLGDRFEQDLRKLVAMLVERPLIGKTLGKRARKFRMRTFRYNVIYVVDGDELIIVAVAHHKRRPGYWRARLQLVR